MKRESVLYLLPTKTPDATDFSATRFDPLLESSSHLRQLFNNVKNVGTKRAGTAVLYIRGSNSRAGLKSIPVSTIMFDEFDEMMQKNIPLARCRVDGQKRSQEWLISTPTFPGEGIHAEFQESTQEHYFFPCPACSRRIELLHENLVLTADDISDPELQNSYLKCLECGNQLTDPHDSIDQMAERKAQWFEAAKWEVTGKQDFLRRGFYINQLYSCAKAGHPFHLASAYIRSLTNKSAEQEYHNSKMGTAHEVEGARITDDTIVNVINKRGRRKQTTKMDGRLITMGVDVGAWLHIEVDAWDIRRMGKDINLMSDPIVLWEGKRPMTAGCTELDDLMRQYQVHSCVIDANPERASAMAFAKRFWGFVKLCIYARGMNSKSLAIDTSESDFRINVDRTFWLDISLGRFHSGAIDLPQDISLEYKSHLKNIARIYEEDGDGNQTGRYTSNGDDHFAHARNYAEIALPFAASIRQNADIGAFL